MIRFIHSYLNKSKPGRKFIRLPQQCDISAHGTTFWNHLCDIWKWFGGGDLGTWNKAVNYKVFPLQFTPNYHWADYKLPMENVYILYVELCPL